MVDLKVSDTRSVVSFLYELMRDHVPAGVVQKVLESSDTPGETVYSNGHLAHYARTVADQLGVVTGKFWLYTEADDKGAVIDARTPEDALKEAIALGWNPGSEEVWCYPLGKIVGLGLQ
jgi:hypothetical protein